MGGALVIIETIEMRIVDAGEIELVAPALNLDMLIDQKSVSHGLHCRDHAERVVIAQNGVDSGADVRAQPFHAVKRRVMGSKGSGAVITGQDAEVVIKRPHRLEKHAREVGCHIDVEVGELQYGEAVKCWGQIRDDHIMKSHRD
jgi:hypothetical protein